MMFIWLITFHLNFGRWENDYIMAVDEKDLRREIKRTISPQLAPVFRAWDEPMPIPYAKRFAKWFVEHCKKDPCPSDINDDNFSLSTKYLVIKKAVVPGYKLRCNYYR